MARQPSNIPVERGDEGRLVVEVQRAVGAKPDGAFGGETQAAVRAFQKSRGLASDGDVGRATWSAMLEANKLDRLATHRAAAYELLRERNTLGEAVAFGLAPSAWLLQVDRGLGLVLPDSWYATKAVPGAPAAPTLGLAFLAPAAAWPLAAGWAVPLMEAAGAAALAVGAALLAEALGRTADNAPATVKDDTANVERPPGDPGPPRGFRFKRKWRQWLKKAARMASKAAVALIAMAGGWHAVERIAAGAASAVQTAAVAAGRSVWPWVALAYIYFNWRK